MSDEDFYVEKVLDHCLSHGELYLWLQMSSGELIWKNASYYERNPIVRNYLKENKLTDLLSSKDILKSKTIVEIVGMRPPNKKFSDIVYVVRARNHVGYLNVSSSDLQQSYPDLLLDFLESHIDFGPDS